MSDTLFANWDAIEIDLNEIIFFFSKIQLLEPQNDISCLRKVKVKTHIFLRLSVTR